MNDYFEQYKRLLPLQGMSFEDQVKEREALDYIEKMYNELSQQKLDDKKILNIIKTFTSNYPIKSAREASLNRLINKIITWLFWQLKSKKWGDYMEKEDSLSSDALLFLYVKGVETEKNDDITTLTLEFIPGLDEETKTKIFNAVRKQQEKEVERMLKTTKPDVSDEIIKFALQEIKTKVILKEKVIKEEDESDKIIHFNDYRNR